MRRALAAAIIAQLRDTVLNGGLALTTKDSGYTPVGGMPPAMCGERYVGVRIGARATSRVHAGLAEEYTAIVTVTMRTGRAPHDRLGAGLMELANGFDDLVDDVRACLNADMLDARVINRANAIIAGAGGPFVTGMEFLGDDDPFVVAGDWFHAESAQPCGVVQHLRFGRVSRLQSYVSSQGVT